MLIVKLATILLIIICTLLARVENKSIFGIGTRILGDQLLVKDVLQAPPTGWSYSPTIRFNYALPEPITYLEILSEENLLAEVSFSYKNELIVGSITAVNTTLETTTPPSSLDQISHTAVYNFEVLITIYGFNETLVNLNAAYVLNRDQDFQGILQPEESDEEYYNQSDDEGINKQLPEAHEVTNEFAEDEDYDNNGGDGDDDADDDDDADFERLDNYIELGHRQTGDYKIYETFQTSLTTTKELTNHSVIFYYVDSNYITYVKFVIFNTENYKSDRDQSAPVAVYSHFSPTTLKAIITDHETTSLFVQMFLYGYKPEDLPVDYQHYLASSQLDRNSGTTAPATMTVLQRIKMLMNARQANDSEEGSSTTRMRDDSDDNDDDGVDVVLVDEDRDEEEEDDAADNGDGDGNNHKRKLPLCVSAAVLMRSTLLITTPMWCTLFVSLFFSIS